MKSKTTKFFLAVAGFLFFSSPLCAQTAKIAYKSHSSQAYTVDPGAEFHHNLGLPTVISEEKETQKNGTEAALKEKALDKARKKAYTKLSKKPKKAEKTPPVPKEKTQEDLHKPKLESVAALADQKDKFSKAWLTTSAKQKALDFVPAWLALFMPLVTVVGMFALLRFLLFPSVSPRL